MNYIAQRESWDCAVAAYAMATGKTYEELRAAVDHLPDIRERGVSETILNEWLWRNGFAWQRLYRVNQLDGLNAARAVWPLPPWASAHVVLVTATDGYHCIAMDHEGRVFDPWREPRKTLAHPDYKEVSMMLGIWDTRALCNKGCMR